MAKKTQQKFEFDVSKLKTIDIDNIEPNDYNPKKRDSKEYKNVVKSIQTLGFTSPIIARLNPNKDEPNEYVVIDGQNRLLAAKELGYKKVPIYDYGEVDDEYAKQLTIFHQVQVPFESVDLSYLVVELADLEMELPYTDTEIQDFREMAEFDFNYGREEPDDDNLDDGFRTLTIKLTPDQFDIVNDAIQLVVENDNVSEGRALELIVSSGIGGYPFDGVDNYSKEPEE